MTKTVKTMGDMQGNQNSSGIEKMKRYHLRPDTPAFAARSCAMYRDNESLLSRSVSRIWSIEQLSLVVIFTLALFWGMTMEAFASVDLPLRWQLDDPRPGKQVPVASAVDSQGNIFLTGSNKPVGATSDFHTIKMNAAGTLVQQSASFDLASNIDRATGIAIDSQDNVVVIGYGHGATNDDIIVIKYDNDLNEIWSYLYKGSGDGVDSAVDLVLDNNDNIYVAGYTQNPAGNMDYLIFKLTPNGANPDNSPIWEVIFNGTGNSSDQITSIATDGTSIAVTGYSWVINDVAGDFDNVTQKYDQDGNLLWQSTYDSGTVTDDSDDRGLIVKMDTNGNVIVTGCDHNNSEIHTFKYTAAGDGAGNGVLDWDVVYDDIDTEIPKGLHVDNAGDVYVTGVTFTTGGKNDFLTVKYKGTDGSKLWPIDQGKQERIFNSFSSDDDIPAGIVVDENGELFVTGYATAELDSNSDFLTLKYKKSTGELLMTDKYDSPSGGNDQAIDVIVDLGLSTNGDVYVAGWSQSVAEFETGTATGGTTMSVMNTAATWSDDQWNGYFVKMTSGPNSDMLRLIQDTDSANATLIVNAFPEPVETGHTYVIVDPEDYDYSVIKYIGNLMNPPTNLYTVTVTEIKIDMYWTDNSEDEDYFCIERCDGINCTEEQFNEIVCEPGTVGSGTVIQFNDADENLVPHTWYTYRVKSKKGTDTYSYPSNEWRVLTTLNDFPPPGWTYINDQGFGLDDVAYGIAVGPDNHPVATGSSNTDNTQQDYYTVKLDRTSSPVVDIWEAYYDDADGQVDIAVGVAVDSNNEVTITGFSSLYNETIMNNTNDIYTTKYASTGPTPAGYPQWAERYDGPGNNDDRSEAIASALDNSNNIVVTGYGKNTSFNDDIYVIKYKPDYDPVDGNELWAAAPFDNGYNDYPTDIIYDAAGDVIVIGEIYNGNGNTDGFISKYSGGDGVVMSGFPIKNLGPISSNGPDGLTDVAVDASGNIYVAGYVTSSTGDTDIYVNKFGSNGVSLWNSGYGHVVDGGAGLFDEAVGIAVDPIDGQIIVGGTLTTPAGTSDLHIIRYKEDGQIAWERNLDALPRNQLNDTATAMAVDASGYICLVGETESESGLHTDILAVKYDFQGNLISTMQFDNGFDDVPTSIAKSDIGEFYISGYSTTGALSTDDYDFVVVRVEKDFVMSPVNISSTINHTVADLAWESKDFDIDGYFIFKKLGACAPEGLTFSQADRVDTIVGPANGYSFSSLDYHDQDYCFGVQSYHGTAAAPVAVSRIYEVENTTFHPIEPDSVTSTSLSTTEVEVCWHDNTNTEEGFRIERCVGDCNETNWVTDSSPMLAGPETDPEAPQTCIRDTNACGDQVYSYRVEAYRPSLWASAFAYSLTTTTTSPILPPTDLIAPRVSDTQADLVWTDNSNDESEFILQRCNGNLASCTPFPSNPDAEVSIPAVNNNRLLLGMNESSWTGVAGELIDGSGSGNDSRVYGGANTVADLAVNTAADRGFDRAAQLDGSNDYITTPLVINQSATSPGATMMAWVNPSSTSSNWHYLFSTENGSNNNWGLARYGATWYVATGAGATSTGVGLVAGQWQHVAAVFQPGIGVILYINGAQAAIVPSIGYHDTTAPLTIGRRGALNQYYFNGQIDEVAVYDRVLLATEISELSNRGVFPYDKAWYNDADLTFNNDYTYQLVARKNSGCNGNGWETTPAGPITVRPETLAPINVSATVADGGRIRITWDVVTDSHTGFRVIRCHGADCTMDEFQAEAFADDDPSTYEYEDQEFCYGPDGVVRYAIMSLWPTAWSELSSPVAEVLVTPGQAPTNITATSNDSEITLTWAQPSSDYSASNGSDIVLDFEAFRVLRCEDLGGGCTPDTEVSGLSPSFASEESQLGWWRMDEFQWNSSANEVEDSSGNYNHGTAYPENNSATVASPGKNGYGAGSFDGANDWIDTGVIIDQNSMSTTGATLMAWVNPAVDSSTYKSIMSTYQNGSEWGVSVRYDDLYIETGAGSFWYYNVVPAGQWTHIAVTWEPGVGTRVYVNGAFMTLNTLIGYDSVATPVTIGRRGTQTWYFNGMIDEARVFSRPLSDPEILTYKNNGPLFSFTDTSGDIDLNSNYIYRVSPYRNSSCWIPPAQSANSEEWNSFAGFTDLAVSTDIQPMAPLDFSCNGLNTTEAECTWTPETTSHTAYTIARCEGSGTTCDDFDTDAFVVLSPAPATADSSYNDNTLCQDTTYTYALRAEKTGNPAWPTDWVYAEAATSLSSPPVVNVSSISESEIAISWTDPNSDEDSFELLRCENNGNDIRCDEDGQYTTSLVTSPGSSGFLLHYNMEEAVWSGVANDIIDHSGNGYNGRAYNGTFPVNTNKYGQAGYFDGTNDYIATTLNIDQSINSTGVTFEAWVRPTLSDNSYRYVISTENGGYDWGVYHRSGIWYVVTGDAYVSTGIGVDVDDGAGPEEWQHIAVIFEPGVGVRFMKNGGIVRGGQEFLYPYINYDVSDNTITIGKQANSSYYFKGWIDEVIVMNKPLFDYALNYKMNEAQWAGVSGEVVDSSGNNNHGTGLGSVGTDPSGKYNRAGFFDSSTYDYISTPLNIDQSGTSAGVTLEAWVYPTLSDGNARYVFSTDNGETEWGISHRSGTWFIPVYNDTIQGAELRNTGVAVTVNQWQHIAVSFTPGVGFKFYKNRVLAAEWPLISTHLGDSNLTIGKQANGSNIGHFHGWIDEVAVVDHNRAIDHFSHQVQVLAYNDSVSSCGATLHYKVKTSKSVDGGCGWTEESTDTVTLPGPPAPENLIVDCSDTTTCSLQWQDLNGSETDYVVKRCDGPISDCTASDLWNAAWTSLPADTESLTDDTVCAGGQYSYRVYAITPCGDTTPLDSITPVSTNPVPSPPALSTTLESEVEIDLSWTYTLSDETGWKIERCEGTSTNCEEIDLQLGSKSYQDFQLAPDTEYCHRAAAVKSAPNSCNSGWQTSWSNQVCQTTYLDLDGPGIVTATSLDTTNIQLEWADGYETETSWTIERCDGDLTTCCGTTPENCGGQFETITTLLPDATNYTDNEACIGSEYTYRIQGANEGLNNSNGGCWSYRVPISFLEFEPYAGVEVTVEYQAGMKPDFSDIRFYDTSGNRELQYWIRESSVFTSATVWVMTGPNDSIYLYYGNSSALDSSATEALFTETYDDFRGTVIDSDKWVEIDPNNKFTQNNGLNLLYRNKNWTSALISRKVFDRVKGNTLYFKVNTENDAYYYWDYSVMGFAQDQESSTDINQFTHGLWWAGQMSYYFGRIENGASSSDTNFRYFLFTDYEVKIELIAPLSDDPGARYSIRGGHYTDWTQIYESTSINYTGDDTFRITIMNQNDTMTIDSISVTHAYNAYATIDFLGSVETLTCGEFNNTWTGLHTVADNATTTHITAIDDLNALLLENNQIELSWTPTTTDEDGFKITRDCGAGYSEIAIADAGTTGYLDPSPVVNATCSYKVTPFKSSTCPWPDLPSNITTMATAPVAPLSITASPLDASAIRLNWNASGTLGESGFEIEMEIGHNIFTPVISVGPNVATYTDTSSINPNSSYVYRIRAYSGTIETGKKSTWAVSTPVSTPPHSGIPTVCEPEQ